MNTKKWLEELSFGSNFGNLRAIESKFWQFWFPVYIFQIKKPHSIIFIRSWVSVYITLFESISSNGSRDIAKSLKISFGSSFVSLRAFGSKFWQFRFPVYTFQTMDGRTDRHFSKKFSFFLLIKNIYTCLYLSRLFLKFHPHSDQS